MYTDVRVKGLDLMERNQCKSKECGLRERLDSDILTVKSILIYVVQVDRE